MSYVTGSLIKQLREKNHFTQKQLAGLLCVSDKTISKWETDRGLPDIGMITELAGALSISVAELLTGEYRENRNQASDMKKVSFYVYPVCGNIVQAVGTGSFNCCGILLPALEPENGDEEHEIKVEIVDQEYYVTVEHAMDKNHYLSFLAYVTPNRVELLKLYPEQNAEGRFSKKGRGFLYAYCNKHGLYRIPI